MAQARTPIRLDGRTLEGGGQLVRMAVALSALTGQPVTIDHIRGKRSGKAGLKASHLAAINTLADLSGSRVVGAQVGSDSLEFYPPFCYQHHSTLSKSLINIRLPTPGSVFLVFQALYPYLLHSPGASSPSGNHIRLSITGGTNASCAPSYDYMSQVLIPNFARLGLPRLSICLEARGWTSGPRNLGKVTFLVETLRGGHGNVASNENPGYQLPSIDLNRYRRGTISRIDVTVLAPDYHLLEEWDKGRGEKKGSRKQGASGRQGHNLMDSMDAVSHAGSPETIRRFMQHRVYRSLRKHLKNVPSSVFSSYPTHKSNLDGNEDSFIPINTHTTEATHHQSHLYVLIVAHTSTGFRIGHDALYEEQSGSRGASKAKHRGSREMARIVKDLIEECVEGFIRELYDPRLQNSMAGTAGHQPCVDEHMRDQLVIFESLGRASGDSKVQQEDGSKEDERYWSLHTKTAQWVCQEILGGG